MYEYRARCVRVVDGDTLELDVDLGFDCSIRIMCRLEGIDTPEIRGGTAESKAAGFAARDAAADWVAAQPGRWPLVVSTSGRSFTRWVGVIRSDTSGDSLADVLAMDGHAVAG